jgi:archaellum component FlaF (FlaF/FlaG flagellin family)
VPTNPAQASVIEGFREAEVLWNKSEQAWRLVAPVTRFVIGDALSHLNAAIANDKQQGIVIVGTDEFFMTKVTNLSASSATVTTCDNGSKITGMKKATGQIDNAYAASPDQAYLLETWNMVQNSGNWAISSFSVISLPDRRAQPCQPSGSAH